MGDRLQKTLGSEKWTCSACSDVGPPSHHHGRMVRTLPPRVPRPWQTLPCKGGGASSSAHKAREIRSRSRVCAVVLVLCTTVGGDADPGRPPLPCYCDSVPPSGTSAVLHQSPDSNRRCCLSLHQGAERGLPDLKHGLSLAASITPRPCGLMQVMAFDARDQPRNPQYRLQHLISSTSSNQTCHRRLDPLRDHDHHVSRDGPTPHPPSLSSGRTRFLH